VRYDGDTTGASMKYAAMLAALVACGPAFGEDVLNLPCDGLPASAVRSVPAPFDAYLDLVCTKAGQAIKAKPGFVFEFKEGRFYLNALNPDHPDQFSLTTHYTALINAPLSEAEAAGLRADLHTIADNPVIDASTILRLRIDTSTGAKKQIYLLIPTNGGTVLGMECVKDCKPIAEDPWFFAIEPDGGH
jgi:hypothetical protein